MWPLERRRRGAPWNRALKVWPLEQGVVGVVLGMWRGWCGPWSWNVAWMVWPL